MVYVDSPSIYVTFMANCGTCFVRECVSVLTASFNEADDICHVCGSQVPTQPDATPTRVTCGAITVSQEGLHVSGENA